MREQAPEITEPTRATAIRRAVAEAAHYLPAQGPIGVFIHHNTLHAFQHLPFHEAIESANELLDVDGYLDEEELCAHVRSGRIDQDDIAFALAAFRRECPALASSAEMAEIEALLIRSPLPAMEREAMLFQAAELGWGSLLRGDLSAAARAHLIEGGAREDGAQGTAEDRAASSLFDACASIAWPRDPDDSVRETIARLGRDRTPRDVLVALAFEDPNDLVSPVIVRLASAYLDEGIARSAMPGRSRGLLASFRELVADPIAVRPAWQRGLLARVAAHADAPAEVVVLAALDELGVREEDHAAYLRRVLLQLPGWAGMFHRLETSSGDRGADAPPASLMELLAVRLTYDLVAWSDAARRELGHTRPLAALKSTAATREMEGRPARDAAGRHRTTWAMFQLAQLAGLAAHDLRALDAEGRAALVATLRSSRLARRRVLHEAYERHYYAEVMLALGANLARGTHELTRPHAQIVFCIDDREESIRRAIEEIAPDVETFGAAGFFGVAMDFRGIDDRAHAPLCPVVVTPVNEVREEAADEDVARFALRHRRRSFWRRAEAAVRHGTRSLGAGALLTPTLGLLSAFPFAMRVLFPRAAGRGRALVRETLIPRPRTQFTSMGEGALGTTGKRLGFAPEEQVARVAALLENIGLVRGFADVVVLLGHGSSSVNNPHHSAYDCGACGGRHGGPNARLFAELANRADVREGLRARGIDIPSATIFVGGQHDTATDGIVLYDVEAALAVAPERFREVERILDQARRLSAHERCRRFESAPKRPTPDAALRHVEGRAEDLSQARPELGHVANAACIVGRRALSRGVFLDRRSFLVSYDPAVDPDDAILERTLLAVGPVGAGINLEYYFSSVDNDRLGSGTKLPHNVAALLGVMEGAESDLRTGLPRQMIEIHEPVRLLLVCEATPSALLSVAARQPGIRELVVNRWVELVSIDPTDGRITRFANGAFEPFVPKPGLALTHVTRSRDYYTGHSRHLAPALLDPEPSARAPLSSAPARMRSEEPVDARL